MRAMLLIYLLLCICDSFGHATFRENDETKKTDFLPSTTSGKQLKIIRDILNQESLARFSMIQKIETLVMDAIDSKNFSQALEKRLSEVVKELGDLKTNDDILNEENTKLKDEIKDLYLMIGNKSTDENTNVQSANDSEILYLRRKTSALEKDIEALSLENMDIKEQLVYLKWKNLNRLKNETISQNEEHDNLLQGNLAFQNQSMMNGRKLTHVIDLLLSMENGLRHLLESCNESMGNIRQNTTEANGRKESLDNIPDFQTISCEKGWVPFEKSCYLFINNTLILKEAMEFCNSASAGAHLLEINSQREEEWIDLQLKIRGFQYIWIGLTDIHKENDFVFISTGIKPTFWHWGKNEPNNSGKIEQCVEKLAGSRWNDRRCNFPYSFVCEMHP